MRPVVLVAAIGVSAVLGGVVGGALVRVADRDNTAEADSQMAVKHTGEISADLVSLSASVQAASARLRTLETVVGGCSCPKPP